MNGPPADRPKLVPPWYYNLSLRTKVKLRVQSKAPHLLLQQKEELNLIPIIKITFGNMRNVS
jgi:hypothetical protein